MINERRLENFPHNVVWDLVRSINERIKTVEEIGRMFGRWLSRWLDLVQLVSILHKTNSKRAPKNTS